jgi:radical SAM protein with 4Fe4S-binding SPASM domain
VVKSDAKSTVTSIEIQDFELWEKMKNKRDLFSFDLEVTARCNNECRHCYINLHAGDKEAKEAELSLEEIDRIAQEAVELNAFWCLLTGGEPLLRKDFSDIYLCLKKKGLLVSVFTNATLVNQEHIELFKKYPPRDIEVSVYGVTPETYDKITQKPGSFAAFERGLDLLLQSGVKVRFKAMALRSNVHELPQISEYCRQRTKDYFRFDPLLHLRFDGDAARNEEIKEERLSPEEIVEIERADPERFESMEKGCDKLIVPEFSHYGCNHLFHCGAGNGSFSVSYDGKFRLCSSLWHPDCVYDLRKGSLKEAWSTFIPKVRDLRSDRQEFLEKCRRCQIINLCLWCPAHSHLETGEMDAVVDYFCRVAHARAAALQGKSL